MKHQTLRVVASWFGKLAWVVAAIGVIASIIIGIAAATILAKIGFLLGGLLLTGIYVLILLAASRLLYLFIDIEESLNKIAALIRKELKTK